MHKDFRMNSITKCMLAVGKFKSKEDRNAFKRAMVDAQVAAEKASKDNQKGKSKDV